MIKAHLNDKTSVPMWAAIGAPLLGVPLMVALLALAVPGDRAHADFDAGVTSEQFDVQGVEQPIEVEAVEEPLRRG